MVDQLNIKDQGSLSMLFRGWVLFFFMTGVISVCAKPDPANRLFSEQISTQARSSKVPDGSKRQRNVALNADWFKQKILPQRGAKLFSQKTIELNLFSGTSLTAEIHRVEFKGPRRVVCVGKIQDKPQSSVLIAFNKDVISAVIRMPGEAEYAIQYQSDGTHLIYEYDPAQLGECGGFEQPANDSAPDVDGASDSDESAADEDTAADETADSSTNTLVDVMVVYTTNALNGAGGEVAMVSYLDLCIADTHERFSNSLINVTMSLIAYNGVDYIESTNSSTDLSRLSGTSDGYMDEVHTNRNMFGADLVCLIVEVLDGSTAGRAQLPGAFSVVKRSSALSNGTFAHELGHNMGCAHDRAEGGSGVYSYSYGYALVGTNGTDYTTTMARNSLPGGRISYFSNPDVSYMGTATGVATNQTNSAYNALTIINYSPTTAAYRESDHDGDGMPSFWEAQYGFPTNDSSNAGTDPDGDYLSNLLEYQNGLNPTNSDSDGDSLIDGWEIQYGLDPDSVLDLSQNISLNYLSSTNTSGTSYGVYSDDQYVYLADGSSGFVIFDCSDPTNIVRVGGYNTPGTSYDVEVVGTNAYVADGATGLQVFNITVPTNIVRIGTNDNVSTCRDVYVQDSFAYRADGTQGLTVIDISIPTNPVIVGTLDTMGTAYGIFVDGDYAYVADYDRGLQIIDVSVPSAPLLVASNNTSSYSFDVFERSNIVYLADYANGLLLFDVSDPYNPVSLGQYNTTGYAYGVHVDGNYAYIADYGGGVVVLSITNAEEPIWVGSYDTPGNAEDVYVVSNLIFVADGASGLVVCANEGLVDSDQDGFLDSWETNYFGNLSQSPTNDFDGDGVSNWGEYEAGIDPTTVDSDSDGISDYNEMIAGTDPDDVDSSFLVEDVLSNTNSSGLILNWPSQTSRLYSVLLSSNLLDMFVALSTNIAATPPLNTYTDAVDRAGPSFYRIDIDR